MLIKKLAGCLLLWKQWFVKTGADILKQKGDHFEVRTNQSIAFLKSLINLFHLHHKVSVSNEMASSHLLLLFLTFLDICGSSLRACLC